MDAPGLVAGIDCSTQRTKAVVVSVEDGRLVASGSVPHTVRRDGPTSECDPEQWWQALIGALEASGRSSEVAAIGVAAQQLGLVLLDDDSRPLRPAILWDDTRSSREARDLEAALGTDTWLDRIGSLPRPGLTVTSWAWVRRHEPDVEARVAGVRLPHDFLTERLTGRAVTDRGDASGTGWWSGRTEGYVAEVLDHPLVGLAADRLPAVLGPRDVAGEVTPDAAAATGLRPGTVVSAGTGDNMAAALALAVEPGEPVVSLGTSGTIYVRSSVPSADATGRIFAQASASGDHLPLACTLNATAAVDRVAALLGLDREDVPARTGVVVLPFFGGERLPNYPTATATIAGLDHATTRDEILLATYEGVVASLVDAIDVLGDQSSGVRADAPITLVGGGSKGRVWRETLQRFSGRPLRVPAQDELVAWGAAAQATGAMTREDPVAVAARWGVADGLTLPAAEVDDAQLTHIAQVRAAADALNRLDAWT